MTSEDIPIVVTKSRLTSDLRAAGIVPGDILCVHTSLSKLGHVIGGPRTVIEALIEAVGEAGTIMMPAYSGDMSDPAEWAHPAVPASMIEEVRREIPGYDPALTPTRGMGTVAELFRQWPGVRRSPHPQSSFSARGKQATELVGEHPLNFRFGLDSPLGKLANLKGKSLLLGAPVDTLSLFYVTQYHIDDIQVEKRKAPVVENGAKRWVSYHDTKYVRGWFSEATKKLVEQEIAKNVRIGAACCVLYDAARTVQTAAEWRVTNGI